MGARGFAARGAGPPQGDRPLPWQASSLPRRPRSAPAPSPPAAQSPGGWAPEEWRPQPPTQLSRQSVATQSRLLGALALLRKPAELDSEGLGKAATAAVREGIDDPGWWRAISARAKELAPQLALHDAALLLNGMARARRLDPDLVKALLPRISPNLVYVTSAHLAMLSSALAKAEVHDAQFVTNLTRELKARLMEFHSAMEVTMVINSLSKLRVSDEDLYRRLVTHVQTRMHHEAFHVRDISVIVSALARVQCTDAATVGRFAAAAVDTLSEATPLELSRLMYACMAVSCAVEDFYKACVDHCQEQTAHMDPTGLSTAAFAFGQCFEIAEVPHMPYLRTIFRHIRLASIASLPLFLPKEVVSLLRTYARWQISFECDHLRKVADRMITTHSHFDVENAVSAIYSLSQLMQRNVMRSAPSPIIAAAWGASGEAAQLLLAPVWRQVRAGHLDVSSTLRAMEASMVLCPGEAASVLALGKMCVVRRRVELDGPTCGAFHDIFSQLGCSPQEDVMLVLEEGRSPSP